MITTETITIGNKQYRMTMSDTYLIQKVGTGEIYSNAIDLLDSVFEYVETDELLQDLNNVTV